MRSDHNPAQRHDGRQGQKDESVRREGAPQDRAHGEGADAMAGGERIKPPGQRRSDEFPRSRRPGASAAEEMFECLDHDTAGEQGHETELSGPDEDSLSPPFSPAEHRHEESPQEHAVPPIHENLKNAFPRQRFQRQEPVINPEVERSKNERKTQRNET